MERTILIYNNRTGVAEAIGSLLEGEEIRMQTIEDDKELHRKLHTGEYHLLLVDVELQDKGWSSGVEMIGQIRRESSIPIVVVSNQASETAKIMALNAGADDYVLADCNPLEIVARVKSQLRRYTQLVNMCANIDRIYKVDGLEINDMRRTVTVEGREVKLTPIEYNILRLLVQQRGRVLSISQIYESIWHMRAIGADNTIAVHIRHIREKIEANPREPRYLKVVWGNGYKVG
ncbi:MAG TPA: response regulator transcription factor [Candidatus Acetatifactor stercoripullorum]|uniref:Stage 0 sporulation protein A homolog n=1 Tax=Candidatus Acetatifactor stercoripullorum TaxID=2838414 RepID=A0A9D1R4Q2_9FIRM|nr:response regulator transcription factor [Candidatus Acetatifactor stercoripullorum]HIW80453.1 response regulator transcription factor [Candidatus Acetatifactor stercoripullorum]